MPSPSLTSWPYKVPMPKHLTSKFKDINLKKCSKRAPPTEEEECRPELDPVPGLLFTFVAPALLGAGLAPKSAQGVAETTPDPPCPTVGATMETAMPPHQASAWGCLG